MMNSQISYSLFGAIVGAAITLLFEILRKCCSEWRERRILRKTLKEECGLQLVVLKSLRNQYNNAGAVHPLRCGLDVFEHALRRHVEELGNIVLIHYHPIAA